MAQSSRWRLVVLLAVGVSAFATRGIGQESTPAPPSPPPLSPTPAGPVDDFDRGTPRSSVRSFLAACGAGDYGRAQNYLDLRRIPPPDRSQKGPELARQLCFVIDRTVWIEPDQLSDAPEGERGDGLPARRENVALIQTSDKPVRLLLEGVPREDGVLIWKFSSDTIALLPKLYQEFGYGPLEAYLPKPFFEVRFLGVRLWQWIAFVVLVPVAWAASWLLTEIIVRAGRLIVTQSWVPLQEDSLAGTRAPLHWLITVQLFHASTAWLGLSVRSAQVVSSLCSAISWIFVAWLLVRLVDVAAQVIVDRAANQQAVAALMPVGKRTTKILVVLLTLLAAFQNLGFNVTGLLAGLGIGGLAVALAGQRTLEHLFGGITLVADQPVRVGEFCRFGDKMGTVVDIGLRSTWVRTPERTLLSIPNGQFSSMQIENFSRRDRMRLATTLSLHQETSPDQLRCVLAEVRKILVEHPRVIPDSVQAHLATFGVRSFDLEITAYVRTTKQEEFAAIREEVLFRLLDVVAQCGTRLAFA